MSASIAAATTVAIGYGAMVWFDRGERPTQETMKRLVSGVTAHLADRLVSMGKRRPDRGTLRERLSEGLRDLPNPLDPASKGGREQELADSTTAGPRQT